MRKTLRTSEKEYKQVTEVETNREDVEKTVEEIKLNLGERAATTTKETPTSAAKDAINEFTAKVKK